MFKNNDFVNTLLLHALLWFVTICVMLFIVPRFERIFLDFEVALPQITIFVLWLSHHVVSLFAFFLVPLFLVDSMVIAALRRRPDRTKLGIFWTVLMLGLPTILLFFSLIALLLPIRGLVRHLAA